MKIALSAAAALIVVFALASCTNGDSNEESSPVTDDADRIIERAAEVLETPAEDVEVTTILTMDPPSNCRFHEATTPAIDPAPLQLAELPDGTIVDDRTGNRDGDRPSAAQTILDACITEPGATPTAEILAATIVRFDRTPGPIRMADPERSTGDATASGVEYRQPALTTSDTGTDVTFFARDTEFGDLLQVTATLAADGTLTVNYSE